MNTKLTAEKNVDTPLTNFPESEDVFDRMMDITITLLPAVKKYQQFMEIGDLTGAANVLTENPDLKACLFDADKYNQFRDALIAMQRFLLNQVDSLYESIAKNAIGINDNPTPEQEAVVAYSAQKVNSLFHTTEATLLASGWSEEAPYTQTVSVSNMKETYAPIIECVGDVENESGKKALTKQWGFVDSIVTGDGIITATCKFKKPTLDLPLVIKGV